MEDFKKKSTSDAIDKDIIYSKSVKAGKRIYYLDVKRSRRGELFLAITESKKITVGSGDETHLNFEKHKIFLYPEDFGKFTNGLHEVLDYINRQNDNEDKKPAGQDGSHGNDAKGMDIDITFE